MSKKKKSKNNSALIWALGWLCIFPIPLTILVRRSKKLAQKPKIIIIAASWLIYLILAIPTAANSSNKNQISKDDSFGSSSSTVAEETAEVETTVSTETTTETTTAPKETFTTEATTEGHRYYILNRNSGKIHRIDCHTLEKSSDEYEELMDITLEWVEQNGYKLCQKCYPYVPSEKEQK